MANESGMMHCRFYTHSFLNLYTCVYEPQTAKHTLQRHLPRIEVASTVLRRDQNSLVVCHVLFEAISRYIGLKYFSRRG